MSFASAVKNDLVRVEANRRCCRLAEFAAFLRVCGCIHIEGNRKISISLTTEHPAAARKIFSIGRELFGLEMSIRVHRKTRLQKNQVFDILVPAQKGIGKLLALLGLKSPDESENMDFPGEFGEDITKNDCCRRAYLRGAFLGAGSMNNPSGDYHLEFSSGDRSHAELLKELLAGFGIKAKLVQRKQAYVIYLKGSEAIADTLNVLGSHRSLLEFENTRIVKDMRNRINRQINCENANLDKTVGAGLRQIEDIKLIEEKMGLVKLPDTLRQAAQARLSNPDSSLSDLAEILGIGRSGVNHRLRRLTEIANDLREKERKLPK